MRQRVKAVRALGAVIALIIVGLPGTGSALAAPPPKSDIVWTPGAIVLTVERGTGTTASVSFTTSKKIPSAFVGVLGGIGPFVVPSPSTLSSVAAGATVPVSLTVSVPGSTAPGDYQGAIVVSRKALNGVLGPLLDVTIHVTRAHSEVTAVSTGLGHTCGLTAGGGVKCWGRNDRGQVGDGSFTQRLVPVDVSGLTSGVVAISAGGVHTCALTVGGGVKCWGYNGNGELGDGTTTNSSSPIDVVGLTSGVVGIAAGNSGTCAITTAGGVKCWGYNGNGEFGNGTTTSSTTAVDAFGLASGGSTIVTGNLHACALTTSGAVKCSGFNGAGQLGNGTFVSSSTPVDATGLASGVSAIGAASGSTVTCVVTAGGAAKCWGGGALGNGTYGISATPVDVSGLASGVASVTTGNRHGCALSGAGAVKCWGQNAEGELGDGTLTNSFGPVAVLGLGSGVASVSSSWYHSWAVTDLGGVKCWGFNSNGQLGNGTTTNSSTPVVVAF